MVPPCASLTDDIVEDDAREAVVYLSSRATRAERDRVQGRGRWWGGQGKGIEGCSVGFQGSGGGDGWEWNCGEGV